MRTRAPARGTPRSSSCSAPRRCAAAPLRSGAPRCRGGRVGSRVRRARARNHYTSGFPMPTTAIVWLRRDLRVHDHPALVAALRDHDRVVPVFVHEPALTAGASPPPTAPGSSARRCASSTRRCASAAARCFTARVRRARRSRRSPRRGRRRGLLGQRRLALRAGARPGGDGGAAGGRRRGGARPRQLRRRRQRGAHEGRAPLHRLHAVLAGVGAAGAPRGPPCPKHRAGTAPSAPRRGARARRGRPARARAPARRETAARAALERFLDGAIARYEERHDGSRAARRGSRRRCTSAASRRAKSRSARRAATATGRLRSCASSPGRDFYAHVLLHHPANARLEHQERFRDLEWDDDEELADAWRDGRTGYPLVDAGMRQLRASGWMHNRARLVAGSFLTKDLHLDWRVGRRTSWRI